MTSLQVLALILAVQTIAIAQPEASHLRGFTQRDSRREGSLEQRFLEIPDPVQAEIIHKVLTSEPHMAGSPGDRRTAEYVLRKFRDFGFDADIEEFKVTLSRARIIKFQLINPVRYVGPHREYVAGDPVSNDPRVPLGFSAYSGSGKVVASVVYANYGLASDYSYLASQGISVAGKIVIVRYGHGYGGMKAKIAEENKASGIIFYSDPARDGYHMGDVYPKGPWRPASAVARGTVLYEFTHPGSLDADRSNVPHLLVMPLSYKDAQPILVNLKGVTAPPTWQGGLPFTYHLGPGPAIIEMQVDMQEVVGPIWNVIAKIRGTQDPEELILVGNHRDAWAYGGVDPNSGTTSMLEMARGLSVLVKEGWRPRRTIWLCSWDGEELGEFGSVSWVEKHSAELDSKAIAYINVDSSVSGNQLDVDAVPSLKKFVTDAAADVSDPSGGSVLQQANRRARERSKKNVIAGQASPIAHSVGQPDFEVGDPGGGTDYIGFLNHLGIPSIDMTFVGPYGVLHSIFDNHVWMKRFGDPKFLYHVTAARLMGLMTLRLAEADVLPLDYEAYGYAIEWYATSIHNKLIILKQGTRVDFSPLQDAADRFVRAAHRVDQQYGETLGEQAQLLDLHEVNRVLAQTERAFLLRDGLPGRPWYKHAIYAPSLDDGASTVVLPAIRQSSDCENFEETQRQIQALTAALNRASESLENIKTISY